MKVGKSFHHRGQHYDVVDSFAYERPAAWVTVYTLRSKCAECGRPFECTASKSQRVKNQIARRCEKCRAPGCPVTVPAARKAKARKPAGRSTLRSSAPRRRALTAPPEAAGDDLVREVLLVSPRAIKSLHGRFAGRGAPFQRDTSVRRPRDRSNANRRAKSLDAAGGPLLPLSKNGRGLVVPAMAAVRRRYCTAVLPQVQFRLSARDRESGQGQIVYIVIQCARAMLARLRVCAAKKSGAVTVFLEIGRLFTPMCRETFPS